MYSKNRTEKKLNKKRKKKNREWFVSKLSSIAETSVRRRKVSVKYRIHL